MKTRLLLLTLSGLAFAHLSAQEIEVTDATATAQEYQEAAVPAIPQEPVDSIAVAPGIVADTTVTVTAAQPAETDKAGAGNENYFTKDLFSHLSVGLELGTAGWGIEVATVLTKNFTLRGGILLPIKVSYKFPLADVLSGFDPEAFNADVDGAIERNPDIADELRRRGLPTSIDEVLEKKMETELAFGGGGGKLLLDYYPWSKFAFHITAGAYIGMDKLMKFDVNPPKELFGVLDVLEAHGETVDGESYYDYKIVDEEEYQFTAKDLKNMDVSLKYGMVKPYFSIGFGRAVSKKRVTFQNSYGILLATSKLTSSNPNIRKMIDAEGSEVTDALGNVKVFPVISFKVAVRLF